MSKPILDREKILVDGKPKSGYLWCLHCERAYKYGEFRIVLGEWNINRKTRARWQSKYQMCPYPGCDGDTVMDAQPWEDVSKHGPPGTPAVPELGIIYPFVSQPYYTETEKLAPKQRIELKAKRKAKREAKKGSKK